MKSMIKIIDHKANLILKQLTRNSRLNQFIDANQGIPNVYEKEELVKLIIIGQDPTVKKIKDRENIKIVLNLDKTKGALYKYLSTIVKGLNLDIEKNIYATNYFKNFFIKPPTQIIEIDILKETQKYWLPLLKDELLQFPNVPIISLGQPVLKAIVKNEDDRLLRYYWGYESSEKIGNYDKFRFIETANSILDRPIFPFPHQPALKINFYKQTLPLYINFLKEKL
jgi:hypothetical protein